jgi:hypothetical protein
MPRSPLIVAVLIAATLLSAGCDMLGDSAEKLAAAKEAEGRAIGSACRHAARAIEDCYAMNKKADKAAMFAGWRDMNDYMRENKIEPVAPQVAGGSRTAKAPEKAPAEKSDKPEKIEARAAASAPAEPPEATVQIEKKPAKATPKPRGEHD